jgi:hypothetical protein
VAVFVLRRLTSVIGQPVYFKAPVDGQKFDVLSDPTLRIPNLQLLATALVPGAFPDENPLGGFALPPPPAPPKPAQAVYLEDQVKIMGLAYRTIAPAGTLICTTPWYHGQCGQKLLRDQCVGSYAQQCAEGHWTSTPIMFGGTDHSPLILYLLKQMFRRMKALRRQLPGSSAKMFVDVDFVCSFVCVLSHIWYQLFILYFHVVVFFSCFTDQDKRQHNLLVSCPCALKAARCPRRLTRC